MALSSYYFEHTAQKEVMKSQKLLILLSFISVFYFGFHIYFPVFRLLLCVVLQHDYMKNGTLVYASNHSEN